MNFYSFFEEWWKEILKMTYFCHMRVDSPRIAEFVFGGGGGGVLDIPQSPPPQKKRGVTQYIRRRVFHSSTPFPYRAPNWLGLSLIVNYIFSVLSDLIIRMSKRMDIKKIDFFGSSIKNPPLPQPRLRKKLSAISCCYHSSVKSMSIISFHYS